METHISTAEQIHSFVLQEYLPLICLFSIVGTVGILGNSFTIQFYIKRRSSSTSLLILFLACSDLLVCIMSFGSVVDMCLNVLFPSKILCKAMYTMMTWVIYSSAAILWIISVDRYYKICRPLHVQISVKRARVIVIVTVFFMMLISLRILFTQKLSKVPIDIPKHDNNSRTIMVNMCNEPVESDLKVVILGFHILEALCMFALCVTLVVSYAIIVKSLVKHFNELKHFLKLGNDITVSNALDVSGGSDDIKSTSDKDTTTETTDDLPVDNGEKNAANFLNESLRNGKISNGSNIYITDIRITDLKGTQKCLETVKEEEIHEQDVVCHELDDNHGIEPMKDLSAHGFHKCLENSCTPSKSHQKGAINTNIYVNKNTVETIKNEHNKESDNIVTNLTTICANSSKDSESNSSLHNAGKTSSQETLSKNCRNRDSGKRNHSIYKENNSSIKSRTHTRKETIVSKAVTKPVKRSEKKATLLMFLVSIGFLCCFLPYMSMRFTQGSWKTGSLDDFRMITWIPFLLPTLNSVLNPLLYFGFNGRFRSFVIEKFKYTCRVLVCAKEK